ncbi:MAG: coenzyme F420-0:L-glutamate ligase [Candidatus Eremiobacteraeota bacterium]|nr:coenzyme F420-0:L-glutamate ligase [Candidatus Eremiobacteraeota bacterium]MCW5869008.1 coenzyme F420-0:L-glutamate ligase [Candidatus Eremiobacteraeota bacterium]
MPASLSLLPVAGIPEIRSGDALAEKMLPSLQELARTGDVLVVTHKIVSKAEGRVVDLKTVEPSEWARQWAERWKKDPRQIEVVLRESAGILRMEQGIIVSRTRHGLVCANAGVDRSNSPGETVCCLPDDPDASARRLSSQLSQSLGFTLPVLISDSFGRAWRIGIVNVAIGVAAMDPFTDYRGQDDPHGYPLEASIMGSADALCAAAELVMGKTDGVPAALVRGFDWKPMENPSAQSMIRPLAQDFFR